MTRRGCRTALVPAVVLLATAAFAASANAATTRAEYVAQVDPVCLAGLAQTDAKARPFAKKLARWDKQMKRTHSRKARARILRRQLRALARFYGSMAVIEQGVNAQIAAIPPAIEDTSLVQIWLRARGEQVVLTQRLFRAFAKGDFFSAIDLLSQVQSKSDEASDLVRDFGFRYCSSPLESLGL